MTGAFTLSKPVACPVWPSGRVGVRLSPLTTLQGSVDDMPQATYLAASKLLDDIGIACIHIAEAVWDDAPVMDAAFKEALRMIFSGTLIYSGHYNKQRAVRAIECGWADLIGFGRPFIANPDLPFRLPLDHPLAPGDRPTYFGGGAAGYTDYLGRPHRSSLVVALLQRSSVSADMLRLSLRQ